MNSRKNVVKIEHFWTGSELGLYPSRNRVSYSYWGRFSIGNNVGFSAITPNTTSTDVWSILVLIGFSDLRRNTIRCGHHLRHHPKGSPPLVTLHDVVHTCSSHWHSESATSPCLATEEEQELEQQARKGCQDAARACDETTSELRDRCNSHST